MIAVQLQGTRTGSTYFYRCLDSHPDIQAFPEMFRISPEKKNFQFLAPNYGGDQVVTFKLMYNHVKHFNLFESLKGLKIMHIVRVPSYKKVLSDIVSVMITEGVEKSHIDPQHFLKHVENYESLLEIFRRLKDYGEYQEFNSNEFITEDSTMPDQVAECVCCFLGVKTHPMKSDSKKLTPDKPHWDYFHNAKEIQGVLKRYGYI